MAARIVIVATTVSAGFFTGIFFSQHVEFSWNMTSLHGLLSGGVFDREPLTVPIPPARTRFSPRQWPTYAAPNSSFFSNYGKVVLDGWSGAGREGSSAHVCSTPTPNDPIFGGNPSPPQQFSAPQHRVCTFRNLCWDGESREFVYFRDISYAMPFEHSNSHGDVFEPPSPFLDLASSFSDPQRNAPIALDWMHLRVEDGPFSRLGFTLAEDTESVHLLMALHWAYPNPGHEQADNTWPAFNTMLETGMLAMDHQLVYVQVSDWPPYPPKTQEMLSRRPGRAMSSYSNKTCFSWAIAGMGGRWVLGPPLPSAFSFRVLHDFVRERYGYPPSITAPETTGGAADDRINIVVNYKQTHHSFHNYSGFLADLARCYPSANVVLFKNEEHPSFREEIDILSNATVYITPGGGSSFSAVFLPAGAVVVYGSACWPRTQRDCAEPTAGGVCCMQIERHIWSRFSHLHVAYYTHTGDVGLLKSDPTVPSYWWPPFNWDYPIDFSAMSTLIDRGLFMSRGRSYNACR